MIVGSCGACRNFDRHDDERPLFGLARFGVCRLGVVPVTASVSGYGGCATGFQPLRPPRRREHHAS